MQQSSGVPSGSARPCPCPSAARRVLEFLDGVAGSPFWDALCELRDAYAATAEEVAARGVPDELGLDAPMSFKQARAGVARAARPSAGPGGTTPERGATPAVNSALHATQLAAPSCRFCHAV